MNQQNGLMESAVVLGVAFNHAQLLCHLKAFGLCLITLSSAADPGNVKELLVQYVLNHLLKGELRQIAVMSL